MKNYKLIPLLAMTAFLAGCNVSNKASSKVKFAKEGKEVEFADVYETFENPDLLGFWTNPNNNHANSSVIKGSLYRNFNGKLTSNKKVVESDKQVMDSEMTVKTDMKNLRISMAGKGNLVYEEKNELGEESENESYNESSNYQFFKTTETVQQGEEEVEEDREYFIEIDNKTNMYRYRQNVTSYDEIDKLDYVENFIYSFGTNNYDIAGGRMYDAIYSYSGLSVEGKAKYKFYQNNQIFTITFEDQYSTFVQAPNGVGSVTTTIVKEKYQLDTTKGESFKYVYETKTTEHTEYYSDMTVQVYAPMGGYSEVARFKGDVYESTYVSDFSVECKVQDVNIKEVDVSKLLKSNVTR